MVAHYKNSPVPFMNRRVESHQSVIRQLQLTTEDIGVFHSHNGGHLFNKNAISLPLIGAKRQIGGH